MSKEDLKNVTKEIIDDNTVRFIAPQNDEDDFDVTRFKLENYEGPLDLLLDLIKDAQIDIKDIFVSEITEQYLAIMKSWDFLDMDKASEFVTTAAALLERKSAWLLPSDEDQEEEIDPENDIIKQLEQHKLFVEASQLLKPYEVINRFTREPHYSDEDAITVVRDFSFEKLVTAFAQMLHKVESVSTDDNAPKEIVRDRFTVAEKVLFISQLVKEKGEVRFSQLFEEDFTKSECINTFLALLELLKKQVVNATQDGLFQDIIVSYKGEQEAQEIGELDTDY